MYAKQFLVITVTLFFYLHSCEREAAENLKKVLILSSTPDTNRTEIMFAGACVISSVLGTVYCWKKLFEVKEDATTKELISIGSNIDLFSQPQNENIYLNLENNQENIANKEFENTTLRDFLKNHKNKLKVIGGITVGTLLSIYFTKKYMTECLTFNLIDNYYEYAMKFYNGNFYEAQKSLIDSYNTLGCPNITTGTYHILTKFFKIGKK